MAVEDRDLLSSRVPKGDESFVGYLLRLTEVNRYETLSWILQLAEIRDYAHSKFSFAFDGSLNVTPLTRLTGIDEATLTSLLYAPMRISKQRMMGDFSVFGWPIPHYLIHLKHPKVCPSCLIEKKYARKIWELAVITACPIHRCLLLDECPSCRRRISWTRREISLCDCGFDWRSSITAQVADSELSVAHRIHVLCGLPTAPCFENGFGSNSPLYKLGLGPFISALIFIGSQFAKINQEKHRRNIDTKGKHFAPSRRNAEIHELLCKALPVFDDWPNNFFSFLDIRRAQRGGNDSGKQDRFIDYKNTLFRQLVDAEFDFIRNAFREYRRILYYETFLDGAMPDETKPTGLNGNNASARCNGVVNSSHLPETDDGLNASAKSPRRNILELEETHISGYLVTRVLNIDYLDLEGFISSGILKAIVRNKDRTKNYLIEKAGLEVLKDKLEHSLPLEEVGQLLEVSPDRIDQLIGKGLLTPLRGPDVDGYPYLKFDGREVKCLLNRLTSGVPKLRAGTAILKSFDYVYKRLSQFGMNLGAVICAILEGEIKPCGRVRGGGIRSLLFKERAIKAYIGNILRSLIGDGLPIPETARLLGIPKTAVYSLIRAQILHAEHINTHPSLGLQVTSDNLNLFNETYIFIKEVAEKHDTSSNFILDLVIALDIKPVSGPKIDGSHIYVFKRKDIEMLHLDAILAEERKKRPKDTEERPLLNECQAAQVLGVDVKVIRQLVERGTLKPYQRLSQLKRVDGEYYFTRYTVEKYKARSTDYTNLISFNKAAKRFELTPGNFQNKYVMTGRLKTVLEQGRRCDQYFRLRDVEDLLKIEKQTIITSQAANILRVSISCISKMLDSGTLKPISGPAIDGFGKNLFLLSDVEELHANREAFKAERVKQGGSSRFGRKVGPKRRPVQDKVGPRIDQLIRRWSIKNPYQRVSGARMHRQLLKEGYQVGHDTVYVYLREHH